jgi:CheY-like chemotaxis protein
MAVVSPVDGQTLRVLVVEDETLIALMLEDMLESLGYAVTGMAPRVPLALAMAETGQFDLAILDVNVGGENVEPVADKLAERHIPFVFATGYGIAGVPVQHRSRPVLAKPFHIDQLQAGMNRALS